MTNEVENQIIFSNDSPINISPKQYDNINCETFNYLSSILNERQNNLQFISFLLFFCINDKTVSVMQSIEVKFSEICFPSNFSSNYLRKNHFLLQYWHNFFSRFSIEIRLKFNSFWILSTLLNKRNKTQTKTRIHTNFLTAIKLSLS